MYNPVQPISILEYLQSLMNAASIKLPDPNQDRFLREPEVLRMTALSRSAMYRRIKDGTFPKHFKIGGPLQDVVTQRSSTLDGSKKNTA